jgi:aspartyl/glutamyl-tRNA(Asn/Gln) amidotransferase C subunit
VNRFINIKRIIQLCFLSKISIQNSERKIILRDLEKVVRYVSKLNQVNTNNMLPVLIIGANNIYLRPDNFIMSDRKFLKDVKFSFYNLIKIKNF